MNQYTNLNIKAGDHYFKYVCEYIKDINSHVNIDDIRLKPENGRIYIDYKDYGNRFDYNNSYWEVIDDTNPGNFEHISTSENVPEIYATSAIDLYFPVFSIDLYTKNYGKIKYAITLKTWIHGHEIVIGSYLISRIDVEAADCVRTFLNQKYYEKVRLYFIDPYDLTYNEGWRKFRQSVCGEPGIDNDLEINNNGSILSISMQILYEEPKDNQYLIVDDISNCQNSINIIDNVSEYLKIDLSTNVYESIVDSEPLFQCSLSFNNVYNGNLIEYMSETYQLDEFYIKYGLIIGNENDIYATIETPQYALNEKSVPHGYNRCLFTKSSILKTGNFTNWNGWKPGINVRASVEFITKEGDGMIYLLSNIIPFTEDLYKFFIKDSDFKGLHHVNLNKVDMNNITINAVNRIENKVYKMQKYEDTKSNIMYPVFFKSMPVLNLIIHPEVNENICINLDEYKSKVDAFIIQIEGVKFKEMTRNNNGVIFKIIGSMLPRQITSGTYYILNEDSDVVTSGKYKYEL